jgi:hypothetical protein
MSDHWFAVFAAEPPADRDTGREGEDGAECDEQVSDVAHDAATRLKMQTPIVLGGSTSNFPADADAVRCHPDLREMFRSTVVDS